MVEMKTPQKLEIYNGKGRILKHNIFHDIIFLFGDR